MLRDDQCLNDTQQSDVVSRRHKSARKAKGIRLTNTVLPSASDHPMLAGQIGIVTRGCVAGVERRSKRAQATVPASTKKALPASRATSKLAADHIASATQIASVGGRRSSKRAQARLAPSPKAAAPASRAPSKRAKAKLQLPPIARQPTALALSRDEGGQEIGDAQSSRADLIAFIRETHKRRNDFLAEEGSLVRRMKRIVCRLAGKKKVSDADLKPYIPSDHEKAPYKPMVPFTRSLYFIRSARKVEEKILKAAAEQLPVWLGFMQFIAGCGSLTLGQIIGDAGDLSKYAGPAKLWKRMGLALIGGERQRKCRDKDLAAAHGYNPRRRALMFIVGDNLIKLNKGEYRAIYDAEKRRQIEKAHAEGLKVAPAAKIPKGRTAEYRSEKHIHLRAKRYMEKRLLRNLWRAWRDQMNSATPDPVVSPAATHEAEAA